MSRVMVPYSAATLFLPLLKVKAVAQNRERSEAERDKIEDLLILLQVSLYEGDEKRVLNLIRDLLDSGLDPRVILDEGLVFGMRLVGNDFRDGILFVPEVLFAANAMKAGIAVLRPLLTETSARTAGKVVIGTVKGDIHDIGKSLVSMMMEGAGFEVMDIGTNNDALDFISALLEFDADILGMSALLAAKTPYMKQVIDTLKLRGIRENYIVLVGGAPLNEQIAEAIGSDAYCRDALVAVETAKRLMLEKGRRRKP